jgi:hypothetical protein
VVSRGKIQYLVVGLQTAQLHGDHQSNRARAALEQQGLFPAEEALALYNPACFAHNQFFPKRSLREIFGGEKVFG